MKISLFVLNTLVAFSAAAALPAFDQFQQRATTDVVVSSDTGTVTVPVDSVNEIQKGGGTDIADALLTIASQVNHLIQGMINDDIKRRQKFTQELVARLRNKWPMHSVVTSNVGYSFSGTKVHTGGAVCKTKIGKDVTYDVIVWDHGTFQLKGDGGFQNVSSFQR